MGCEGCGRNRINTELLCALCERVTVIRHRKGETALEVARQSKFRCTCGSNNFTEPGA